MPGIPAPIDVRFARYVRRDAENSCWEWRGCVHPSGYGRFRIGGRGGKSIGAHRVAFEIANGPIPSGLLVMHACDNRLCVNPAHLSLGTYADNNADMMRKGRHVAKSEGITAFMLARTKCKRGHPYSPDNTYIDLRGVRVCRACRRLVQAARKTRMEQM